MIMRTRPSPGLCAVGVFVSTSFALGMRSGSVFHPSVKSETHAIGSVLAHTEDIMKNSACALGCAPAPSSTPLQFQTQCKQGLTLA